MQTGEISAIGVAVCWTFSALFFEKAGNRIGSLAVNIIRLAMAIVLLGIGTWVTRGMFVPLDATAGQWFWLSLSGFVGFFLGDLCLFYSYTLIGSRMKILTLNTTTNSQAKVSFQKELNSFLKRGRYEQMMETRNKSDQSTVYGYTDNKGVAHLLIVVKNDAEMSLIVMKGNLTHEDLEKIAK